MTDPPSAHPDAPAPARAIRAFVALPLPEALAAAAADVIRRLAASLPDVRFVPEEGLHATLRFLGWTRGETVTSLEGPLRAAAANCPPADVAVRGLGMFPERGSPRVLWLGLAWPAAVQELQAACERAAVAAGFEPETRPFHPHVTLGRWRDRARRPSLPEVDLGSGRVDRLVVFRSELRSGGSVYTPLTVLPLGGAPPSVR